MSYNEVNSVQFVKKETGSWPHALETFVESCFERSKSLHPDLLPVFQKQLQDVINDAAQDNTLWDKNWAQVELPVFSDLNSEPKKSLKRSQLLPKALPKALPPPPITSEFDSKERKRLRLARFQSSPLPSIPRSAQPKPNGPLIGYSNELEKHYLRLTSEPDPAKVRPQPVLEKTLDHIIEKYKKIPTCTYLAYLNNQFKSMRQDLTVQHIKNDFTIKVYETHARIAIDNDDLGEFNQCQTQLKYLYQWKQTALLQQGPKVVQKNPEWDDFLSRKFEFMTYKILYMLMTENNSEIYKLKIAFLKENDPSFNAIRTYKCVVALFDLQSYMIHGNYYQFFRIYRFFKSKVYMRRAAHLMTGFLVDKQRVRALETVCKSYRQLAVNYLMELMDFSRNDPSELELEGSTLRKQNISLFFRFYKLQDCEENGNFDCIKARGIIQNIVFHEGFRKIDIKGQI